MDKAALGARIAHYRETRELTQEELADALGYPSHSRVANYEAGRRTPSLEDAEQIAQALGITVNHLVSDVDFQAGEATSYLSGDIRGHFRIKRLDGFDKQAGPNEIYLPEFIVRQRVPHATIGFLRWLRNPTSAMRPRIEPGAFVLVDTSHTDISHVIDGETYAIRLYGRPDIKRIQVMGEDSLRLVSDRETDNRYELGREDFSNLQIGGLVVDSL